MNIRTLQDANMILRNIPEKMYGVGVTAFTRIIPAMLLGEKFDILCYKDSLDNALFEKMDITKITSLEKIGESLSEMNTLSILQSPTVQSLFVEQGNIALYPYKNTHAIDSFAGEKGYHVIGNPSHVRDKYENKKIFREMLHDIGVETIPGENVTYEFFMAQTYEYFSEKYSCHFVVQLPDILIGGGLGTLFIKDAREYMAFQNKIREKTYRKTEIHTLNVTRFITGVSSSITACATAYGTLTTNVQMQIIDIAQVINPLKGNGLFCGHDWSFLQYSDRVNKKAQEMTRKIGDYMYQEGYKGIFGLDLIVDPENDDVSIVECNPRYTGAFPMISLIDLKNGVIPMDVFHILELLNSAYEIDFEEMDAHYKYQKAGSHIVLSNICPDEVTLRKDIKPGIYRFEERGIHHVREGFSYSDMFGLDEFIIIDGNTPSGEEIQGLSRICHLLFPGAIMKNEYQLSEHFENLIQSVYREYIV